MAEWSPAHAARLTPSRPRLAPPTPPGRFTPATARRERPDIDAALVGAAQVHHGHADRCERRPRA
eukprot:4495925-Prymnesium_polylepis.1